MPCIWTHATYLTILGLICVIVIGPPADETRPMNNQNQEINIFSMAIEVKENSIYLTAFKLRLNFTNI